MRKPTFSFLFKILFFVFFGAFSVASELRWAADAESGVPYVFYDAKNPDQLKGFEYDLIQLLSKKMNLTAKFVQNAWDGLIPGLERGEYDIAINGIEILDERKKVVLFSDPYYATNLKLVVRAQ